MEVLYKVRLEVDGLIQLSTFNLSETKTNHPYFDYGQVSIIVALRLAKSWITKIIKLLNPEENSLDILDIDSGTNISYKVTNKESWTNLSNLDKIDFLIQEIDMIIFNLPNYQYWKDHLESTLDFMSMTVSVELPNWSLERDQVYIHLQEAKMFLGFELLNIKENV